MKLLSIFKKDLMILLRDRAELAVLFLMPLAFIIPISLALGSGDGYGINRNNTMILLPVINYDQGPRAQVMMTAAGQSLKLEYGYNAGLVQAVGLADDTDCRQAAVTAQSVQATATAQGRVTVSPSPAPTTTGTTLPSLTPTEGTPAADGTADATGAVKTTGTAKTTPAALTPTPVDVGKAEVDRIAAGQTIARCEEKVARAMVQRGWRAAALIIPAGFSQAVDADKPAEVNLVYDPGGDPVRRQQIEGVVRGATVRLSIEKQVGGGLTQLQDLVAFAPAGLRASVKAEAEQPAVIEASPALSLEKTFPENYPLRLTPDTYQQTIPGYTVMYVFFIITTLAGALREEQLNGTFRRLLSAPVARTDLLGGKLLAAVVIGLAQVILLFAVGALAFKLNLGSDPLAFFLLSAAMVGAAAALGLAAATTRLKGAALAAPLVIAALLGGCLFPLDLLPPFLRAISWVTPHRWALTGYQNLMVRGQGLQEVFPQIAVLVGFAVVFFFIALRRFNFDSQEAA